MKQTLSLILALVLCLSLCACGGSRESADAETSPDNNHESNSNNSASANVDFEKILLNNGVFWGYINCPDRMIAFNEDGTTIFPNGAWSLDGNIVNCTWDDGRTDIYEIKELNGVYYLVGDSDIMYSDVQIAYHEIPRKSSEITLDNWRVYFELGSDTYEILDQFGEPTGETTTSHYLKLKDEYYRYLVESDSEVLLRFSINGNEQDRSINGGYWDSTIQTYYFGIDNVEMNDGDVFEMIKIQGTLYFVDGL